jgi:peptidoglycan/xylan/chitin deacetylase (PgdA/CDA1 family)
VTLLRSTLGNVRERLLSSTNRRPVSLRDFPPTVSFCFDDFPRSAYLIGGSILHAHGARGTYYAAVGLMGTRNELGEQFRQSDLDALLRDGHELASHTFHHLSCRAARAGLYQDDAVQGRRALAELTGQDPANFAYPYGHVSIHMKRRLGTLMRSCRGIYSGVNEEADLNLLRANSLYGKRERLAEATRLVTLARQRGGWLIFYTHDVRENPSPYGCTPELLEAGISAALAARLRIATVADVLDEVEHCASTPVTMAGNLQAVSQRP